MTSLGKVGEKRNGVYSIPKFKVQLKKCKNLGTRGRQVVTFYSMQASENKTHEVS